MKDCKHINRIGIVTDKESRLTCNDCGKELEIVNDKIVLKKGKDE